MSEADKMLEELGYKKIVGDKHTSTYLLKYYKDNDNVIYFSDTWGKGVSKGGEYSEYCDDITMQELKAINKKCEELGWI